VFFTGSAGDAAEQRCTISSPIGKYSDAGHALMKRMFDDDSGNEPWVARVSYEFRVITGEPSERLCAQLGGLSSEGWDVVGITHGPADVVCLLRREKDFEVARSLMTALEEEQSVEAISQSALGES
jgi:hypothetical protein